MAASGLVQVRSLGWEILKAGGWEYLLPDGAGRRWLCVDASGGVAAILLAGLCGELHVRPAGGTDAQQVFEGARLLDIANLRIDAGVRDEPFDGFVLHDLRGALDAAGLEAAVRSALARLKPGGFAYVAARNRHGYTRLRRMLAGSDSGGYASVREARGWLGTSRPVEHYPLIADDSGRVHEVVPSAGYVSAKNPALPQERVRRVLLGARGAPRFSPAFALLARGTDCGPSGLQRALRSLVAHGCMPDEGDPMRWVKRYHVLNGGKAVVSAGVAPGKYGTHILVLVRWAEAASRRRHEAELLARLARLPGNLSRRTPRALYETESGGIFVFAMEEFAGVTLDAPGPGLTRATADAVAWLIELHQATREPVRLAAPELDALLAPLLDRARARYPALAPTLQRLDSALRRAALGAELPLVWMHGDFKVENIVVEEGTSRLLGVIDWELAQPRSLPLLDLWYLLVYNRQTERRVHFFEAAPALFEPGGFDEARTRFVERYCRAVGVEAARLPFLSGAFLLHHCARRVDYLPNERNMAQLTALMDRAIAWMEGAGASGAAPEPERKTHA